MFYCDTLGIHRILCKVMHLYYRSTETGGCTRSSCELPLTAVLLAIFRTLPFHLSHNDLPKISSFKICIRPPICCGTIEKPNQTIGIYTIRSTCFERKNCCSCPAITPASLDFMPSISCKTRNPTRLMQHSLQRPLHSSHHRQRFC